MKIEKLNYNLISKKKASERQPGFGNSVFFIQKNEDIILSKAFNKYNKWFEEKFKKANFNLINTADIQIKDDIDDKIRYIFPTLTDSKIKAIKLHFSNIFDHFNPSEFILNTRET